MKMLRKNVDLDTGTVAVLQIEATLNGYGTLKPYLEALLKGKAEKSRKERPKVYSEMVERKVKKMSRKKGLKIHKGEK